MVAAHDRRITTDSLAAAYELGIGETTVRQHLSGLYRRTGCLNAAQAAYWLATGELGSHAATYQAPPDR